MKAKIIFGFFIVGRFKQSSASDRLLLLLLACSRQRTVVVLHVVRA